MNTDTRLSQTRTAPVVRTRQMQTAVTRIALGLIACLTMGLSSPIAYAQTYYQQTLHTFGAGTDGQTPYGNFIQVNGILYSTTIYGGTSNKGTIFAFNPATNTETILYSFSGTDGSEPYTGLLNVNGILYGTTVLGGTNNYGTVFSYNLSTSTESTLYNFKSGPLVFSGSVDGANPQARMINVNGKLYGTTFKGGYDDNSRSGAGPNGEGTIFSFDPATNTENPVYPFLGTSFPTVSYGDGGTPVTPLLNVNGILYGTTEGGGAYGFGTVFTFDPSTSKEGAIHSFTSSYGSDGSAPLAGLLNVNGILYGTTSNSSTSAGSGTLFSYNLTSGTFTTLYNFTGNGSNGAPSVPTGDLIYDPTSGRIYGTTREGGTYNGGTVYSFDPANNRQQTIYNFNPSAGHPDGSAPTPGMILINKTLYGVTRSGGANGKGTIFSIQITTIAPIANNDIGRTYYNTTLTIPAPGVLGNDSNGGAPPMSATLVSQPAHGTLVFNSDGSFKYTPFNGYLGTDSFTYQDTNPVGTSNVATCTLTVQARTPIANNDNGRTYYNTTLNIAAPGVLGNDSTGGSPTTPAVVTQPTHGSLVFGSDGSFQYVPNTGYVGTDSFTYQDTNSLGTSNVATVTLTVQPRTPIAVNDSNNATHNTTLTVNAPGVLNNDSNGGSLPLTAALVTSTSHGTVILNGNGGYTYTPNTGFTGTDSFTYQDTNAVGTSNVATCTLTVQ